MHTSASFETTLRSLEVNSKSSFRSGPFRSGFETLLGVPLFVKGQYLQCLVTFGPPCLETRSWLRAKSKLGGMASEASFRSRFAFYCISILDRVGINRILRKPTILAQGQRERAWLDFLFFCVAFEERFGHRVDHNGRWH